MKREFLDFEELQQCPSCGCEAIPRIQPDIAECAACKLLFRNPRPTQAEIARSYDTGGTFDAWQEQEPQRAAMWGRRAALLRRFQPSGRLLDVGTGDGRFLQASRDLGYEVAGTEVSKAGAEYARQKGFDVKMGQIVDLDLPLAAFDLATIWHVLEHVPDPGAVLRKVRTHLRPGGILAVAVPNEENYFFRRRFGKAKASPFEPLKFGGEIHLTYFRPRTLRSTLRAAGFDVLSFGVDDLYMDRDWKMRAKFRLQTWLAQTFHWHFGVAMYAICRRSGIRDESGA